MKANLWQARLLGQQATLCRPLCHVDLANRLHGCAGAGFLQFQQNLAFCHPLALTDLECSHHATRQMLDGAALPINDDCCGH